MTLLQVFAYALATCHNGHVHIGGNVQLNATIRRDLRARRICEVKSSEGDRRLVLVPEFHAPHFHAIESRGGAVLPVEDIAQVILRVAAKEMGKPYARRALLSHAPAIFSCSTLTRFVFAHVGVWLPRYAIEQSYVGTPVDPDRVRAGDLVFWHNRFPVEDEDRRIGHVGIVGENGMFLDSSEESGCVDQRVFDADSIEGACRIIPDGRFVLVQLPPEESELDTAETVATWLQRLR